MPRRAKASGQGALFESRNLLFYGDNLHVLREQINDETVDLVYLDPPFNKGQDHNLLFKEKGTAPAAQIKAFKDTWRWDQAAWDSYQNTVRTGPEAVSEALQAFRRLVGSSDMLAYLSMMAPRLVELHRVLRPTGSIYLHCDPTASHYLKLLMDAVFGPRNFRSEIIWKRTSAHNSANRFGPVHDVILFYGKSESMRWQGVAVPHHPEYVKAFFRQTEPETGRKFHANVLTGDGTRHGESGQPWRGYDPTEHNRHWAVPGHMIDALGLEGLSLAQKLDALDEAKRVYWPKKAGGTPRLKYYADELDGMAAPDVWTDVRPVSGKSIEKVGYPTQKPEELLERILTASSAERDTVLDPFCGCGTAVSVAQYMGRRWIGIDIAKVAIGVIEKRLVRDHGDGVRDDYEVRADPASVEDALALADDDKHAFQDWALGRLGAGRATHKKGADKGIDGRLYYTDYMDQDTKLVVVSVKGGGTKPGDVRDLRGVMEREHASLGVFVMRKQPTKAMREEAAEAGSLLGGPEGMVQRLQIVTVADLFDPEKKKRPVDFPAEAAPIVGAPGLPEPIPVAEGRRR